MQESFSRELVLRGIDYYVGEFLCTGHLGEGNVLGFKFSRSSRCDAQGFWWELRAVARLKGIRIVADMNENH